VAGFRSWPAVRRGAWIDLSDKLKIMPEKSNFNLRGKRVLIFQQRSWAKKIGHFLAKKLQAEGCRLAAITHKRTTHEFILNQAEVKYDLVINNDEVMSRPKDYLQGDSYSLTEICQNLGIDSIWPLVATMRNHVRSYKDKYYYGFKQNVSDEDILDYVMAVYKYLRLIFDQFKPDIIISPNFVALSHLMFNFYAHRQGIKMIAIIDSKVKGISIFSHNYLHDEGPFYQWVDVLNQNKARSENQEKAKKYIQEFRQAFKLPDSAEEFVPGRKASLIKIIRRELAPFYHVLQWYLKRPINVLESTGITPDWRPPRIILRDHYCQKKYRKFMNNYQYYPFTKIKKYVYFPLQFQPEETIDVIAPFFSNQIETARQVAMSLPDDYTLVVKEHPAMVGLRPPSYLEKVARTVNIKLIDYHISSEDVLKRADLVISPSSTTLAEAAFLNKPAIQLGNLGTTLKLPNVFRCTDMTQLSKKIKEVLSLDLNNPEYERRLENFVAAIYDTGTDFNYHGLWEKGSQTDQEILWQFYRKGFVDALS